MMTRAEAFTVAQDAIADRHDIDFATIGGKARAIPAKRDAAGTALNQADQKAADAFNWLSDNKVEWPR